MRYLLERPAAAAVMRNLLAPLEFTDSPLDWRGQVYSDADPSVPDLVGRDRDARPALIIEAKFRALLTQHQPGTYLDRQSLAFPNRPRAHLLVFLVPWRRQELLIAELVRDMNASKSQVGEHVVLTDAAGRRVVVVSWRALLGRFTGAFTSYRSENGLKDDQGLKDLAQLAGLCDRADTEPPMPFTPQDLSSEHGLRYWQFLEVVEDVVRDLEDKGVVTRKGLRPTYGKGIWGLYFRAGDVEAALAVLTWSWAVRAATPWWLRVYDPRGVLTARMETMRSHPGVLHLMHDSSDGTLKIGLRPWYGLENEVLVAELAKTMADLCARLAQVPAAEAPAHEPGEPSDGGPDEVAEQVPGDGSAGE